MRKALTYLVIQDTQTIQLTKKHAVIQFLRARTRKQSRAYHRVAIQGAQTIQLSSAQLNRRASRAARMSAECAFRCGELVFFIEYLLNYIFIIRKIIYILQYDIKNSTFTPSLICFGQTSHTLLLKFNSPPFVKYFIHLY